MPFINLLTYLYLQIIQTDSIIIIIIIIIMFVYLKLTSATNTMKENKTKLRCKWRNGRVDNINVVDWNNQ